MSRITGTLHEVLPTFMIICSRILLRMKNVSYKCTENQNTHSKFNKFFSPEKSNVYEIMWKSMVEPESPQMTILRMLFACWITKVTYTCTHTHTHTNSEYVKTH